MRFPMNGRRCSEVNEQNTNCGNAFRVNESAVVDNSLRAVQEAAGACAAVQNLALPLRVSAVGPGNPEQQRRLRPGPHQPGVPRARAHCWLGVPSAH